MTRQLDMVPLDAASLERLSEQMPKPREVAHPRLPEVMIPADDVSAQGFRPMLGFKATVAEDDTVTMTDARGGVFVQNVPGAYAAARNKSISGLSIGWGRADLPGVSFVDSEERR